MGRAEVNWDSIEKKAIKIADIEEGGWFQDEDGFVWMKTDEDDWCGDPYCVSVRDGEQGALGSDQRVYPLKVKVEIEYESI